MSSPEAQKTPFLENHNDNNDSPLFDLAKSNLSSLANSLNFDKQGIEIRPRLAEVTAETRESDPTFDKAQESSLESPEREALE